jgi:hypothetical protein
MDNTSLTVIAVAAVAVLVLIIVFMAADAGSNTVYTRYIRTGGWYPRPGGSARWGPYYQHGGQSPSNSNGLLY